MSAQEHQEHAGPLDPTSSFEISLKLEQRLAEKYGVAGAVAA